MNLHYAMSRLFDRACDMQLGIQTHRHVSSDALGYTSTETHDYAALPYLTLRSIFKSIGPDLRKGALIDYGCGLGRVVVYASKKGFRRVIGVEYAESLVVAGRPNLARYPNCEMVCADAALYEVPNDATVFLFANPFHGKIMEDTLRQIVKSLQASPRPHLFVGYNNAQILPRGAAAAGIALRQLELHGPTKHEKVWATWTLA